MSGEIDSNIAKHGISLIFRDSLQKREKFFIIVQEREKISQNADFVKNGFN